MTNHHTSSAADPEALRPVEPGALIASIQELNAWESRADGELLTQAEGESIILVLHELKRLIALAAGQAEPIPAAQTDSQPYSLLAWEAAHRIAYQAAAAFRPSYFHGSGFQAHNWVVEAIRTAHMDGQRFARDGSPPSDRSGALPAELRQPVGAAITQADSGVQEDAARWKFVEQSDAFAVCRLDDGSWREVFAPDDVIDAARAGKGGAA